MGNMMMMMMVPLHVFLQACCRFSHARVVAVAPASDAGCNCKLAEVGVRVDRCIDPFVDALRAVGLVLWRLTAFTEA
jgi:hypothetical protein